MPATWPAIAFRKSMSAGMKSRSSTLCTLSTPTNRSPASIGTESMDLNRF